MHPLKVGPLTVPDLEVTITHFQGRNRPRGRRETLKWSELVNRLEDETHPWPKTKNQLPLWSGAVFRGDHRRQEKHERTHVFLLDYDEDERASLDSFETWWSGRCSWVAHTSASHMRPKDDKPIAPRWRVVLLLSRPLSGDEHKTLGEWFVGNPDTFGVLDSGAALDYAKQFYVASQPPLVPYDVPHVTGSGGAGALDVDTLLESIQALQEEPLGDLLPAAPVRSQAGWEKLRVDGRTHERERTRKRLEGWLRKACQTLASLSKGSHRHDESLKLAFHAGGYCAYYPGVGFTRAEAIERLFQAIASTGYTDLRDARRTIEEGFDKGAEQPIPLRDTDPPAAPTAGGTMAAPGQPGAPAGAGAPPAFRWLEDAWKASEDLSSWVHEEPPPQRWLLVKPSDDLEPQGVLPMGKVGMLAAEGGAGKTMALMQLAIAVAMPPSAGAQWFGFDIGGPAAGQRVLLVLGEEDAEDAWRRVRQVVQGMGYPQDALKYLLEKRRLRIIPGHGKGHDLALVNQDSLLTGLASELLALMREDCEDGGRYSLVILDPASRFSRGQFETENGAATALGQALELLASAPGNPTVLISHHTNQAARGSGGKASATDARGVTAFNDAVRWHAGMKPQATFKVREGRQTREVRTVSFDIVKSNVAPLVGGVLLERGPYGVLYVVPPDKRAEYAKESAIEEKLRALRAEEMKQAVADEAQTRWKAEKAAPPKSTGSIRA